MNEKAFFYLLSVISILLACFVGFFMITNFWWSFVFIILIIISTLSMIAGVKYEKYKFRDTSKRIMKKEERKQKLWEEHLKRVSNNYMDK